jgi:hypothetical protein
MMFTKTMIALSTILVLATAFGSAADAQSRSSRQQAGQVGYGAINRGCITNGDDSFLSAVQSSQVC